MSDVNVVGMPEFNELLDHIYEYGTVAEGVVERANALARAVIARYTPPEGYVLISEEVLRVWGKLDEVRECCRYPKHAASQPAVPTTDYQEPAMTTEVELLPLHYDELPEIPEDIVVRMQAYARANVARAIAAKDAEVEALRTEAEQHLQQAMSNGAKARAVQAEADNLRTEVERLRAEVDALARENEAMRRCAIRYLRWLGVTHKPLDAALREDMANPDMCGDAALAQEDRDD